MAYLYEDKELVYEKQMASLKKRIILVNLIMFITNFITTLILLSNKMHFVDFLNVVLPIFLLNLIISYAILINRDSNEQLYLAMYISIIGTIVVMVDIFLNVQNPATYMLIYLAIAIISVFKDKKAVGLGYVIIFFIGTIINFKYDEAIVNYSNNNYLINHLTPYLYEGILVLILIVQAARTFYNEKEIDDLYEQLDTQKEVELKYHRTIFDLMAKNNELLTYTDQYVNDETKERINNYVAIFNESFYIKEDLVEKVERYFNLQTYHDSKKTLGKKLGSYQLKKEISHFEEMSTFKLTKLISLVLSITYKNQKNNQINDIKNFELLFMNPEMSLETQILGFIFLYEHLRNDKPYIHNLSHYQIVEYFKTNEAKELFRKEILEFFIAKEQIFNNIYEKNIENLEEEKLSDSENSEA